MWANGTIIRESSYDLISQAISIFTLIASYWGAHRRHLGLGNTIEQSVHGGDAALRLIIYFDQLLCYVSSSHRIRVYDHVIKEGEI